MDPPDRSAELAARLGVTFPLLSDVDRAVVRAYGVHDPETDIAWSSIFLVDPRGQVRWRSLGDTYKVRPTAEVVLEAVDRVAGSGG